MTFQIKTKPFFDPLGNFNIPNDIPFGGQLNPKLTIREWFLWILDNSINVPKNAYQNLVGSKVTIWRLRKKLKLKGYE